jgi:NAD(P)-dependent dehydrogenase (short-subunit alcohol dehydrogenase family)
MTVPETSSRSSLVVGGTKGIGGAIARQLALRGPVAATYRTDATSAQDLERWARDRNLAITTHYSDVSTKSGVDDLVETIIERCGRLDVVVFCAVDARLRSTSEISEEDWRQVLGTNASPFLWLGQRAAELLADGGRLIALTSPFSHRYVEGYGVTGPSKAALESLVVYLAVELAAKGITVNAVSAGLVDTELLRANVSEPARLNVGRRTPTGRIGRPEDVAAVVDFLAGVSTPWLTGQIVTTDGGYFLR